MMLQVPSCSQDAMMTPSESSGEQAQLNLTTVILVSLVAGTLLFIVNTVILGSYCHQLLLIRKQAERLKSRERRLEVNKLDGR